jgi:hypothetical protein
MSDKTIPQLDPVVTPAATDRFGVRQAGDTEDKRETRAQVHTLEVGEHLVLPQVNEPATPTLAFGDGNTGFYEGIDNDLRVAIEGVATWQFDGGRLEGLNTAGPALVNETPLTTNPTLLPNKTDLNTGIGWTSADRAVLVAQGNEVARWISHSAGVEQFTLILQNNATFPSLAFGDGDSGFFEDSDDSISQAIAGVVQEVTGPDGKLFINTLTGVGFQGSNIVSATPDKISIYAAGSATNAIDGGAVEIWGGYAAGAAGSPEGGRVGIWGGGGGGSEATGGNIEMFGGEADVQPGDIILTGGVATNQGNGGFVRIVGGAAFGTNATGGRADVLGGLGIGTGGGGQINITGGQSGSGATGNGGAVLVTSGDSLATSGAGGLARLESGLGRGTGAGGLVQLLGGVGGVGGANSGDGGGVSLTGGGNSGGSGAGGAIVITGGNTTGTGIGGAVSLIGGAGAFNSDGGLASLAAQTVKSPSLASLLGRYFSNKQILLALQRMVLVVTVTLVSI